MSLINKLRSIEVSPRTAIICIAALLVVAITVLVTARNIAVGGNSRRPPVRRAQVNIKEVGAHRTVAKKAVKGQPAAGKLACKTTAKDKNTPKTKPLPPTPKPTPETPMDPYAVIAERNLFRPLAATASPSKANQAPGKPALQPPPSPGKGSMNANLPALPPGKGAGSAQLGPPPGRPNIVRPAPGGGDFKKTLAFTGIVETSEGKQALLENLQTKETRFVKQGENAFGCRIVSVTAQMLSLEKDGTTCILSIGENKPDTTASPAPQGGPQKEGGPPPGGKPG
jgi:hypothetical protein